MDGYLRVSSREMENDAECIDKLLENVPALIGDLQQAMNRLSGCWDGPAWVSYQRSVAQYVDELTQIYEQMGKYTVHMREAAKEYTRVEQDICSDINSIYVL